METENRTAFFCFASSQKTVNTVEAIWMKSPSEVDDAKYDEFYQFIAKAFDKPLAKVCQRVDIYIYIVFLPTVYDVGASCLTLRPFLFRTDVFCTFSCQLLCF